MSVETKENSNWVETLRKLDTVSTYNVIKEKYPCANHKVCSEYVESKDTPLCVDCAFLFDTLIFLPPKKCIICNEIEEHVQCPGCSHACCIDCFQILYWDGYVELRPAFPGTKQEEEAYKINPQSDYFKYDDAIQQYELDMDEWERGYTIWEKSIQSLQPCFICANKLELAQSIVYSTEVYLM